MTSDQKYAAKNPGNSGTNGQLDDNTIALISAVTQATVTNMSKNEAPTSEIDTATPPSFSGNSFGGSEEAKKR